MLESIGRARTYRVILQSGDTRVFTVPFNQIAHVTDIEIDSTTITGVGGVFNVQFMDTYPVTGGTTTTTIRKEVGLSQGQRVEVDITGIQFFGGVDVRSSISGISLSITAVFR